MLQEKYSTKLREFTELLKSIQRSLGRAMVLAQMAPKFRMSAKDFSFLLKPPLSHGKFYGTQRGTAVSM